MTGEKRDTLCGAFAESIREAGRAGRLADADWLRSHLEAQSLPAPGDEDAPDMNALLAETLAERADVDLEQNPDRAPSGTSAVV